MWDWNNLTRTIWQSELPLPVPVDIDIRFGLLALQLVGWVESSCNQANAGIRQLMCDFPRRKASPFAGSNRLAAPLKGDHMDTP